MNSPASLVLTDDGNLQLQGAVTFDSTPSLYEECQRLLLPGIKALDCRGIQESDSSAISLLLACRRLADNRAVDLRITGMGEQLLSLARLYDVEKILAN
jgi:ABC-type transporter Mla MlaB component